MLMRGKQPPAVDDGTHEVHSERCSRCARTPLVGERVHLFADGAELCELCSFDRPEAAIIVSRVHPPEARGTVRLLGRVPAGSRPSPR